MEKPFSPACERNKDPILEVLKQLVLETDECLLEVAAGTTQHAIYIAPNFAHMDWIVSEKKENHSGMKQWLDESEVSNIVGPIEYEIGKTKFPKIKKRLNYVFTSNSLHYMPWKLVKTLAKELGQNLSEGAQFLVYGPFNYQGEFTSEGNLKLDQWLKEINPEYGIRNFEDVCKVMNKNGLTFFKDFEMPANNRLIVFTKI